MRYFILMLTFVAFACGDDVKEGGPGVAYPDLDTAAINESLQELRRSIVDEFDSLEMNIENGDNLDEPITTADATYDPEDYDVDWEEMEASMPKDFSFVIVISTPDYDAAVERAKEAAEKLGYPLDFRDLHRNEAIGLSLPRKVCEEEICGGGLEYPIYIPRGLWDNGKYVSVEYSNGFEGFTPGYYIVVVASGERNSAEVNEALKHTKQVYDDAYAKTCPVFMGCGC